MKLLELCVTVLLWGFLWPPAWAIKPGQAAPDLLLRDRQGAAVRLSGFLHERHVALLALPSGSSLAPAVLEETCRRLEALNTAVVFLEDEQDGAARKFLDGSPPATVLIDSGGVVRRLLPGRALTGQDLADFVKVWLTGKAVFGVKCARCHGENGDSTVCLDVKPLAGVGLRLSPAQIRERLHPGELNDREVVIRGEFISRPDVDALLVFVAGL